MVCNIGEMRPGTTTLTVERGGMTLVIKRVPARVCGSCSEGYFDEATTKQLGVIVEGLERSGVQIAVQDYDAA